MRKSNSEYQIRIGLRDVISIWIARITYVLAFLFFVTCQSNPGRNKSEKIDYLLQKAFEDKSLIGSVLVADQGKIIYEKSFGNADQESNRQNSDTTRFLIGSISKPITAILVLRLVDKGIIKLDDTISDYFSGADPSIGKINIHQLLTHTSGITEIIGKEENMDIATLVKKAATKFEPGSDFDYSNSGYVILKTITEIATKTDYVQLVKTEVFDPARMTSSGVARSSNLPSLAHGYKDGMQTTIMNIDFPIQNVDGAGSLYSTVGDLYKLDRILYTDSLLSEKMKVQMLKQHVSEKYSYGWFVSERSGLWDVYWHKGNLSGFTSFISRRVQKNQFIVILSNVENAELSDMEKSISKILKDEGN